MLLDRTRVATKRIGCKQFRRKVTDKKMETVATLVELTDEELKAVAGGFFSGLFTTVSNDGNASGGTATGGTATGGTATGGSSNFG